MTAYAPEDLSADWEFKILRSQTGAFRNGERLAVVLDEESVAGWELVEKFDNGRIRLKRPASSRMNDAMLPAGYDPYRSQYGIGEGMIALMVVFGIALAIGTVLGILYTQGLI